jgi:PrcB C-terminal
VTTIAKGDMSAIDEPRQVVVRDAAAWSTLWRQHNWDAAAPTVDFATRMVVGVFLGTRPSAGFSVEITGAAIDGETLVVKFAERRPERGAIAAQVLTMPFHLAKVPVHKGPVRFEQVEGQRD